LVLKKKSSFIYRVGSGGMESNNFPFCYLLFWKTATSLHLLFNVSQPYQPAGPTPMPLSTRMDGWLKWDKNERRRWDKCCLEAPRLNFRDSQFFSIHLALKKKNLWSQKQRCCSWDEPQRSCGSWPSSPHPLGYGGIRKQSMDCWTRRTVHLNLKGNNLTSHKSVNNPYWQCLKYKRLDWQGPFRCL